MKVSQLNESQLTDEMIDKIIFEGISATPVSADCIMVLGSQKAPEYRVPEAVALYKNGYAAKIMMCGGKKVTGVLGFAAEAKQMQQSAICRGVPMSDVLMDEISMTTKENILCGALILDRTFRLCNVKEVLLVTGNYHMRRSLAMANTYMPQWIHFTPCPAPYDKTNRAQWFQTPRGKELVTDEAKKIISYIREGSIPDFEI